MELIRKAANDDGDFVIFQRIDGSAVIYQVVVFNSRTSSYLHAFSESITPGAMGQKYLEKAAQIEGSAIFEEACGFMGLMLPEVDE